MMVMVMAKAAAGDPSAIRDVNFLRSMGFIKVEPKVDEPKIWEIFDKAMQGKKMRSNWYLKSAGR